MGKGLNSFGRKQRREMRRRNHIARDLGGVKYRQRIKHSDYKQKLEKIRHESDDNDD